MVTVALGVLTAGTGRALAEAHAMETAAAAGDTILESIAVYRGEDHPGVRGTLAFLRRNKWSVTLRKTPAPEFTNLSRVELRLDHPDLRQTITLIRLVPTGNPAGSGNPKDHADV